MKNTFYLFEAFFFLGKVLIYGFSSIYICMWQQLLYHNVIHFQHLFIHINLLFNSQISLVSLCCWCIWLRETLFQTRKSLPLLPKGSIQDSMNIVSTEATSCSWIKTFNKQLHSLHDWHCQHCPLTAPRSYFHWFHKEC